jgi:hypothetical protein
MSLDRSFNDPECKTASCRNKKEAICPILKTQSESDEAEGYPPPFDSEQPLIIIINGFHQLEILFLFEIVSHRRWAQC